MSETPSDDGIALVPLATVSVAGGDLRSTTDPSAIAIASIREGRWEGERLRANVVGPGADWAMPGPAGAMLLDVRQVIETDEGAVIYVTYDGRAPTGLAALTPSRRR